MVSCGAPGGTNRADKNSNIITAAIIIMLLELYRDLFRMPEEYSKSCQTSKMMRHIENLGIVKTAHWGIIKHIQQYSAMFRHIHGH